LAQVAAMFRVFVNLVLALSCFLTCAALADDRIDNSVDALSGGGHLMRRQDPVQKGQKSTLHSAADALLRWDAQGQEISPHSNEDALIDDLDEEEEEQNDSDDKAPEYFEGNVYHADSAQLEKMTVYGSESDVRRECSESADCFGYWKKTKDNSVDNSGSCSDCEDEFRMLKPGHHYWSVGKPYTSVKSVMVKKKRAVPLSCDNECQIGECTGGCNRRRSDGCCMSRRRDAGKVPGKCKDASGTPTCIVVDDEADPNPIPSL